MYRIGATVRGLLNTVIGPLKGDFMADERTHMRIELVATSPLPTPPAIQITTKKNLAAAEAAARFGCVVGSLRFDPPFL